MDPTDHGEEFVVSLVRDAPAGVVQKPADAQRPCLDDGVGLAPAVVSAGLVPED